MNLFLVEGLLYFKPPVFRNRQKMHEIFKNQTFLKFVNFGPTLRHFAKTNRVYFFKEAYWRTRFFLAEPLLHSKPPSFSINRQKLHEFFENLIFLGLLSNLD